MIDAVREFRIDRFQIVEKRQQSIPVVSGFASDVVDRLRSVVGQRLRLLDFRVENSERCSLQPILIYLRQLIDSLGEISVEIANVVGAAFRVAEVVQTQLETLDSELGNVLPAEFDDFGIDFGRPVTDCLYTELVVLTDTSGLRALVAEHRGHVEHAHRLRSVVKPVLDVSTTNRRRPLGPKRDRISAVVLERIHLFLNDVSCVSNTALEKFRVLK